MPERIQLSRAKGYRKPEGAIVVARPTKWGNPFGYRTNTGLARVPAVFDPNAEWEYEGRISADGMRHDYHHPDGKITVCHIRYMTRAEIVETYRQALLGEETPGMNGLGAKGKWLGYWVGKRDDRRRAYITVEDVRRELAGKDLACWCPLPEPGQPDHCHAAVLLQVANSSDPA